MLTEKDYCDYETCVALKELGLSCDDIALRYEDIPNTVDTWRDSAEYLEGILCRIFNYLGD